MKLKGKAAFITGGASGLGLAMAEAFGQQVVRDRFEWVMAGFESSKASLGAPHTNA